MRSFMTPNLVNKLLLLCSSIDLFVYERQRLKYKLERGNFVVLMVCEKQGGTGG